ncbi:MAG: (4Fe-4S)-binding protein, partial [Burkholderiales bacterium]
MGKQIIRGTKVVVEFDGGKCIHSRHCVLDSPAAFVPNAKGQWIHPDAVAPEAVMRVAHNCPSGAITARRLDGGPDEAAPAVNVIRVLENGPLAARAAIELNGQPIGYRATLCRCGQSNNKPFCDGSHVAAGFVASGEPASKQITALEKSDRPLI